MAGKKPSGTRVRDAGSGRFVPKAAAKQRPKSTVTETIKPKKK